MKYQQCNRCVMDTSAYDISFDEKGNCNYCTEFLTRTSKGYYDLSSNIESFISKVKKDGMGKKYDCIVGVSGGADSSYTLYLAKKYGLRVLAVHMDNGWNSELASNNIETIISKMEVDLYTHVINWHEYKKLMYSFFDADVINVELLYDNAMLAVNYRLASKYGIKYILSGSNNATEGMMMPANWNWNNYDKRNIKSIAKTQNVKIKTFPLIGTLDYLYFRLIKKIKWIPFLDYVDYDKEESMEFLEKKFQFKKYPYKHYESVFTRFYQGYILPTKFGVDKRKLHFSNLIMSNQMKRAEAIEKLNTIPYNSKSELLEDKNYVLKKLSWTDEQFQSYISRKEIKHSEYLTEKPFWDFCLKTYQNFFKSS